MTAVRHTEHEWRGFAEGSEAEFRLLLEKLPAAAYTTDAHGLITYFNRRAIDLWGREPRLNDPTDRFCGSFRLFDADGQPISHDRCWMARALNERRAFNGEEIVVEREDGTRVTALAHANPILDGAGELVGAVNVLVDITDRKQAEGLLREADRAKDEFLATLAHELRNPLAPMQNAVAILRHTGGLSAATTAGRSLDMLERQVAHLTRIVDDLIDLSRITHNSLELRIEEVDLASIVRQAVEMTRPLAERQGIVLQLDLTDDRISVRADPVRLAQVFTNLLNNACKYTPPGGRVVLATQRQGSDGVVSVLDNGQGIAAETLPVIFDMFMRVGPSARSTRDGLGVGLTLTRRIVEQHGGTIEARSDGPDRGSEFRVRLPAVVDLPARDVEEPSRAEPAAAAALPEARVLVVDDNIDAADSLRELLVVSGCDAAMVHDGIAAVEAAERLRPDIVLLDIGLPGMNGYDVARRIRRHEWGRRMLLVAITGWGQDADRRSSSEAGFDRHLVKPVRWSEMEEVIALVVSGRTGA